MFSIFLYKVGQRWGITKKRGAKELDLHSALFYLPSTEYDTLKIIVFVTLN